MGLPNFMGYYHAAQLAQITLFHAQNEIPLWVSLEAIDLYPLKISNLLWLPPTTRGPISNPITGHSLKLWDKLRGPFKLQSPHSPLLSFLDHPNFYPAQVSPNSFQIWHRAGLCRIRDFVSGSDIKTFASLQNLTDIPNTEIFRFLQISHFIRTTIGTHTSLDDLSLFEGICNSDPHAPGLISLLYAHLTSPPNNLPPYTAQWSADLALHLDTEDWSDIWSNTKISSQNIIAQEANYKVLMRWYLVPARIAKFLPNYPANCFRGCNEQGTHAHIWWSCSIAQEFWAAIFQIASTLFQHPIEPDPAIALLNLIPSDFTRSQTRLLLQLTTAAKQTIARAWKTPKLSLAEAKNRVTQAMIHSKIEATILDRIPQHLKIWNPWTEHFLPPDFDKNLLNP